MIQERYDIQTAAAWILGHARNTGIPDLPEDLRTGTVDQYSEEEQRQILDDILDIEGDQELMGKTLGKDAEQGKCNYAYVHGLDAAKEELHRLTSEAKEALSLYGSGARFFIELAGALETRNC